MATLRWILHERKLPGPLTIKANGKAMTVHIEEDGRSFETNGVTDFPLYAVATRWRSPTEKTSKMSRNGFWLNLFHGGFTTP